MPISKELHKAILKIDAKGSKEVIEKAFFSLSADEKILVSEYAAQNSCFPSLQVLLAQESDVSLRQEMVLAANTVIFRSAAERGDLKTMSGLINTTPSQEKISRMVHANDDAVFRFVANTEVPTFLAVVLDGELGRSRRSPILNEDRIVCLKELRRSLISGVGVKLADSVILSFFSARNVSADVVVKDALSGVLQKVPYLNQQEFDFAKNVLEQTSFTGMSQDQQTMVRNVIISTITPKEKPQPSAAFTEEAKKLMSYEEKSRK